MAKSKFPKILYVTQDDEDDTTFGVPYRTVDDIPDNEKVGVYVLDYVKTLKVTRDLE